MSAMAQPVSLTGTVTTRVRINGRAMSVTHEARVSLLDLLRERLLLTGTKKGCNRVVNPRTARSQVIGGSSGATGAPCWRRA